MERIEEELPTDIVPQKGPPIFAHGEVTGHAHAVEDPKAAMVFIPKGTVDNVDASLKFATIKTKTRVTHQEHAPIALTPGIYKIIRQREYSPEAIRRVAD